MPDLGPVADLHFLRPLWLWGLLPAVVVYLLVRRRDDPTLRWRGLIDPHLLEALRVRPKGRGFPRPAGVAFAALVLGCLGAAGPTWEREPSPFTEDKAPLVVALDLSESMLAIDVPPTRLERAKEKIRDLLARRAGARTGLVAYAGTAHLVMPPTDDSAALETYLAALDPDVMPRPGKAAAAALGRAQEVLARDETPGSILFLTDGIPAGEQAAFRNAGGRARQPARARRRNERGRADPPRQGLRDRCRGAPGRRAARPRRSRGAGPRRRGLRRPPRHGTRATWTACRPASRRHLQAVQAADPKARWKDAGYWLTIPFALLGALWFRRGWTVRWTAVLVVGLGFGAPRGPRSPNRRPPPARPAPEGWRFADLWLTRDQQGRLAYEGGDFAGAAASSGTRCGRASPPPAPGTGTRPWTPSRASSRRKPSSTSATPTRTGATCRSPSRPTSRRSRFGPAGARPARTATAWRPLIPKPKKGDEEEAEEAPDVKPDEVKFDDKGKKGKEGRVDVSEKQAGEIWLRGPHHLSGGIPAPEVREPGRGSGESR